jgi:hypothetical protein
MRRDRKWLRLTGNVDRLEERYAPGGGFAITTGDSQLHQVDHHGELRFVARLSGAAVVTTSSGSTPSSTSNTLGVITPAKGSISFQVSHDGHSVSVVGILARITNVSVITLREGAAGTNGPTVAVLLNPGAPGPTPHAPFQTVIKAPFLTGPLQGKPVRALVKAMRSGDIYALVQTSNGVDSSGPFVPGNFPKGELRGQVKPI